MQLPRPSLPAFSVFTPRSFIEVFDGCSEASATFDGAALFVDLSNYTSLAETLCREGTDGRETLSQILNRVFSQHVDCIYRAGGEIASFMGDGVLAFWHARTISATDALASAESCAIKLHRAQRELAASSEMFPDLHIGIAVGELWAARLGGVDRVWHQILAGPAARDAFMLGNRARPGQTIMVYSEPAEDTADPACPGLSDGPVALFQGPPEPRTDTAPEEGTGFVPRMMREWWSDERRRWLPQIRTVNVLFAKLDNLPEESDGSLADYQRAVVALQRAVRPYSALAGALVVDDKGLVFKTYFGMPYNCHRNDEAQAIQTGMAIRQALAALDVEVSIGIANGEGICMPIGGDERMEYTAIGRFAHLAARLMDTPGQEILCTSDVAARAGDTVRLAARAPIALKGLARPIPVFSARAVRKAVPATAPLIGRAGELALIGESLDRLRAGQGGVLHILGDAGIGKTALVDHLTEVTAAGHLTALVGRSTMSEVVVPFHSWRSVFASLLDVADHDEPSDARTERVETRLSGLPSDERRLLPLINAVLPDLIDARADIEKLGGEARVEATLSFLARLVRHLAPPGFILVLEDCHWMDSASWRLLERLTSLSDDMLIVLTSRPQPEDTSLRAIRTKRHFRELTLAPLPTDAIRQIILALVPAHLAENGDRSWLDQAAEFAAGNALYAKEFAYLIAAEDKIGEVDKVGEADQAEEAKRAASGRKAPGTVSNACRERPKVRVSSMTLKGLIASRLDSLKPPELLTLKAASVIGSRFDLTLLGKVAPGKPEATALRRTLADLLSRHLILAIDRAAHLYAFQHDLIREVVYGQLTRDQRQLLHKRTAGAIETVHRGNPAAHFATLADHWSKADDGAKTLTYAELAADQAIRSGGYVEAKRLLGLCFDHAGESDQVPTARRLRWHRLSADTQCGLGNLAARLTDADAALSTAGVRRLQARPHLVIDGLKGLAAWGGHRLLGRLLGRLGTVPAAEPSELSLELARIYRHHAAIAWFSSDPVAMTAHSIAALRHAEKGPESDVLAGASVEFGGILGLLGMREAGRSLMRRALAIAKTLDDRSMLAYVRLLTCLYEVGVGNWRMTDSHALACENLADDIGDYVNWSNVQAVRFWSPFYQNDIGTAEALAERFRARQEADGNDQHRAWAYRFVALCAIRRRRPDVAVDLLERASAYLASSTAANEKLPAIGLLALARHRNGDRDDAVKASRGGLALIEQVGRPTGHAMLVGYAALAEVSFHALMDEPNSSTRQAAFAQCIHGLDRYQRTFPIGRPRYRIWRGLGLALKGRHAASRRDLILARASAGKLAMSWEWSLADAALKAGPARVLNDLRDQDIATAADGWSSSSSSISR